MWKLGEQKEDIAVIWAGTMVARPGDSGAGWTEVIRGHIHNVRTYRFAVFMTKLSPSI